MNKGDRFHESFRIKKRKATGEFVTVITNLSRVVLPLTCPEDCAPPGQTHTRRSAKNLAMNSNTPTNETDSPRVQQAAMSVEHPFLLQYDSASITVFLCKYDAYCSEFSTGSSQPVGSASLSLKPVNPVSILRCVYVEQLESAVEFGMIDGCIDIDKLIGTD